MHLQRKKDLTKLLRILQKCGLCGVTGASVGCNAGGCKANYHFVCARTAQCVFLTDKKVFCQHHKHLADNGVSMGLISRHNFTLQTKD